MFRMLTALAYFILLKYMVLKPLVATLPFRLNNLFYNISYAFCCMFFRSLGKHLLLQLDKIVYQLFWIRYSSFIEFTKDQHGKILYKDEYIRLYGIFYHVAL